MHLVSCSRDCTIRIWDATNGFMMITLQQHSEWVRRISINFNGEQMASASKDETVIVWNLSKIIKNLNNSKGIDHEEFINTVIDEHEHVIDCIKFAPD
jgi:platelet-activating factor acetylhydrolase IB subunit alpha